MDIDGHQTPAGGTIPPSVLVTTLKPDIVIIEKSTKKVTVFELTVPAEHRIETANKLKQEKYAHLSADATTSHLSVIPFEIGSHTGYVSRQNKKNISALHKFCQESIKLKKLIQNISAITVLSSYFVFNCRNQDNWEDLDPILAPFPNQ